MSRTKDLECRAVLVSESRDAICVRKANGLLEFWLPRSQIGYMRRYKVGDRVEVVFTLPEWLVETKDAWELVP